MVSGATLLRAWTAYLPTAACFSSVQVNTLFRLAVLTYLVGALVGAAIEVGAFADGALFIYGIASGDPWHLNWNNMPVRTSTYLLTIESLTVLVRQGLIPLGSIAWLYSLLFLSLPFLFLLLCVPLVVRRSRYMLAYPAIQMLTTGLFLYGFPSDLWVSQGEFWVALLAVIGGANDRRRVPAFVVAFALLLFSHDAAILLGGLIFATLLGRVLGFGSAERSRSDIFLLGYAGILLAIWLVTKLTYTYPDPVLARAIAHGAGGLANPLSLVRSKAFLLAFVTAAIFFIVIFRRPAAPTRWIKVAMLVMAGVAAGAVYAISPWPGSRYMLRGVMLGAMLILGALAVADTWQSEPAAPDARSPVPDVRSTAVEPDRRVAWTFLLIMAITVQQDVRNIAFARDWATYRHTVRSLTGAEAPANGQATPQLVGPAAARLPARERRLLKELSWGFALPFQSFVFSEEYRIDRMLFNPVPMPYGCAVFRRTLAPPSSLPDIARDRIADHVCANQPSPK